MYQRLAADRIREALADTRVVLLAGPRQAGKAVLYDHDQTVHFGDRLAAVPLSSLWS